MPLRDDAMLQMTIAIWLSANGYRYHEVGVPAEIDVFDDPTTEIDEFLHKVVEVILPWE